MITAECIFHCFLHYLFILSSKVRTWGRIFKISFNERVIKYIEQEKNHCTKQLYLMILWCHMKCFALKNFLREKKKNTNELNPDSSKTHNYIQKHKNFQLKCHVSRDNWNSKTKIKSLTAVRNGFKLIKLQVKIVSGKRQNP